MQWAHLPTNRCTPRIVEKNKDLNILEALVLASRSQAPNFNGLLIYLLLGRICNVDRTCASINHVQSQSCSATVKDSEAYAAGKRSFFMRNRHCEGRVKWRNEHHLISLRRSWNSCSIYQLGNLPAMVDIGRVGTRKFVNINVFARVFDVFQTYVLQFESE